MINNTLYCIFRMEMSQKKYTNNMDTYETYGNTIVYVCMYVCMYVFVCVFMYVCMYVYM